MKNLPFFVALMLSIFLASCSHTVANRVAEATSASYPAKEYRIQPGDQLDIKLFYNPELNEQLTVRSDGKITLQLVNDVVAAGLTPSELTMVLTKAYSPELANPKIAVIVRASIADKVYVDGEVNRAGLVNLVGPMTVMQSISQAGGLKDSAKSEEIIILRKSEPNKYTAMKMNLRAVMEGKDTTQDILLSPSDIVYVPKSTISNINTWVDLYIRKNIPLPIGLGYSL
jgi:polysaccharide biosynthesis/export protein